MVIRHVAGLGSLELQSAKGQDPSVSRFTESTRAFRPLSLVIAGLAVATVAVVVMAANPGRAAADPGTRPPASAGPSSPSTPATTPPPAVQTPIPTAVPTAKPSAEPTQDGQDAMPITLNLTTYDRHRVSIDIVDRTGSIVSAVSGKPGDNPTADGLVATNLDDRTIELTWVDFPIDNRLGLFVDEVDGHLQLLLIQPAPTSPTDAVGMDRKVILRFDHAVDASSVKGIIQEGLDT